MDVNAFIIGALFDRATELAALHVEGQRLEGVAADPLFGHMFDASLPVSPGHDHKADAMALIERACEMEGGISTPAFEWSKLLDAAQRRASE